MRRLILLLSALTLTACATGPNDRDRRARILGDRVANPSALIAADLAQSRLAAGKGAYAALAETASDRAVLFTPRPVDARQWLRDIPPVSGVSWQPHAAYLSCDGRTGITTGAIRWGDVDGSYTTIWRQEGTRPDRSEWRWLVSHGDARAAPLAAPDFLRTQVADCGASVPAPSLPGSSSNAADRSTGAGHSRDNSLRWSWKVEADNSRTVSAELWNGSGWDRVIEDRVEAPEAEPTGAE